MSLGTNREILLDPNSSKLARIQEFPPALLSSLISDALGVAQEQLGGSVDDRLDAQIVIMTLVAIVARALRDRDRQRFEQGAQALADIWDLGDPKAMWTIRPPDFEASLWESLTIGLYALGGLAVRLERWQELRELATRKTTASGKDSWLRQGQAAVSRGQKTVEETAPWLAHLRLMTISGLGESESLEAVARFDLIASLITAETDPDGFYPNAAQFSESLVEPIVVAELRNIKSPLRQFVFAGDNDGLRRSLNAYNEMATSQAAIKRYFHHEWGWRSFEDGRTWLFIRKGHDLEEWIVP
jgi:hypothetical protein